MGAGRLGRLVGAALRRVARNRRGNVSPVMALMLVPVIGSFGFAAEASRWFVSQRGAQNAVDAAVIAAARNDCAATDTCHTVRLLPTYDSEAKSVTKEFGFTHNGGDVDVATSNTWPCPGGGNTCYSVLMTLKSPLYLLRITGFDGDATAASGQPAQLIQALAVAKRVPGSGFCITAYSNASDAILFQGAAALDLTGCDMHAPSGGASCNAHTGDTIRYAYVNTAGDGKDCGQERTTPIASANAYAALASNIPNADTNCPGASYALKYPQSPRTGGSKNTVDATKQLSGTRSFSASSPLCGDHKLSGNLTVTGESVMVIENGRLDLAGFTLTVATGGHLTIVFGGTNTAGQTPDHIVMSSANGAVIDYAAPTNTSGTWSGVALYQDPALTTGVNMLVSGNNPEFNITGLIYAPKAQMELSGAINHATAGDACLAFVVDTLRINGTGSIFAYPTRQCDRAGLTALDKVNDKVVLVQ